MLEPNSGYLYEIDWSRSRASVFAVSTGDGTVLVYDLLV